jgi:hypothetical protein
MYIDKRENKGSQMWNTKKKVLEQTKFRTYVASQTWLLQYGMFSKFAF